MADTTSLPGIRFAAKTLAAAGNLDGLKELLNGPDLIRYNSELDAHFRANKVPPWDDHNRKSMEFLLYGAAEGQAEVLRYLLNHLRFPSHFIPEQILFKAVDSGSIETVHVLLNLDPPTPLNIRNSNEQLPLCCAMLLDDREEVLSMTELLLQKGADPNLEDGIMVTALCSPWPELAQLLLRYGAKSFTIQEELRLLPTAARRGCLPAVIRLLDKGADINDPCGGPSPPLYWAVDSGCKEVVKFLLRAGADPNMCSTDPKDKTPLKNARFWGCFYQKWAEIVDILLEFDARE